MSAASDSFDVMIIGAGAAGIAAARAAIESGAKSVAVVSAGAGTTEMSAGWITADAPVHENARSGLAWLDSVGLRALGAYEFATITGVVVSAVSGLASLLDLRALPAGTLGVVDLVAGAGWSADLVARSLADALGRETRVITVAAGAPRGDSPAAVARTLDTPGITDAFAHSLGASAHGCAALLFPPVLGLLRDTVAAQLAQALGMPVGESGGSAVDPPAVRLASALARALPREITRLSGRAVVRENGGGRARVTVDERVYDAAAVVLATGGLASGGIAFDGMFLEPCAQAPVWLASDVAGRSATDSALQTRTSEWGMDPVPLFSPSDDGRTGAMSAGVRLLPDGRVMGPDGHTPAAAWLFAAGAIVSGEHSAVGPGLASVLVSGRSAGTRAALHTRSA